MTDWPKTSVPSMAPPPPRPPKLCVCGHGEWQHRGFMVRQLKDRTHQLEACQVRSTHMVENAVDCECPKWEQA